MLVRPPARVLDSLSDTLALTAGSACHYANNITWRNARMSDVRLYAEESEFERLSQNIVFHWKFTDITSIIFLLSRSRIIFLIKEPHCVTLLKLALASISGVCNNSERPSCAPNGDALQSHENTKNCKFIVLENETANLLKR